MKSIFTVLIANRGGEDFPLLVLLIAQIKLFKKVFLFFMLPMFHHKAKNND